MTLTQIIGKNFHYFMQKTYFCSFQSKIDMMNSSLEDAKRILNRYIESHNMRKTSERLNILECIYSIDSSFDMESLQQLLLERKFYVSRATLYNTLQLFLDCNLVMQLPIRQRSGCYQCTLMKKNRHHMICMVCGKEKNIKNLALSHNVMAYAKEMKNFKMLSHAISFYGICAKCQKELEKE